MRTLFLAAALLSAATANAAVIGYMTPPERLSEARIAALPASERPAWAAYVERSKALMAADKAALASERRTAPGPYANPRSGSVRTMPLDKPAEWYSGAEAKAIAANILSFQTPAGGWGKNMDRTAPPRTPGQAFVPTENLPPEAREDIQAEESWRYVGTIDNGATTTEMRFLARMQAAYPGPEGDRYRTAFLKGLDYLLVAQFPNGGYPQVYPLQGGYHDMITFNDDAVSDVAELLQAAGSGKAEFAFVPAEKARAAAAADERVTGIMLATQVRIDGKLTVWGQQHDPLTLQPVGARNFEPIALSSSESAAITNFLMKQKRTAATQTAVAAAVAWFQAHALKDVSWPRTPQDGGKRLIASPGAAPIWPRFTSVETGKPIFGDRDRTIHDDVHDLIPERRNGYAWYGDGPLKTIAAYEKWKIAK